MIRGFLTFIVLLLSFSMALGKKNPRRGYPTWTIDILVGHKKTSVVSEEKKSNYLIKYFENGRLVFKAFVGTKDFAFFSEKVGQLEAKKKIPCKVGNVSIRFKTMIAQPKNRSFCFKSKSGNRLKTLLEALRLSTLMQSGP